MTRHSDTCKWIACQYTEDNNPVMIRLRGEMPPGISTSDYPVLVNLYWREDKESLSGMPSSNEMDRMLALDELLNAKDGPDIGFMMFSVTGNHRKEWIWYTKDENIFLQALNEALTGHDRFPIQIETGPAGDWQAYRNIVDSLSNK